MSLRKLAGQTAVYGISSIAVRFINYLLTPYITRILTESEYGVITDIYSLIPLMLVILSLGLETAYFRFAGECTSKEEIKKVYSVVWGTVIFAALVFLVFFTIFIGPISSALDYANDPVILKMAGWIIFIDLLTTIPFAKLREEERAARFVFIRFITVITNVCACVFFYSVLPKLAASGGFFAAIYDPDLGAGYFLVSNIISSIVALACLMSSGILVRPRLNWKILRPILLYSIPLLIGGIAGTANEFIDRQMIKFLMPEDIAMSSLGVFGAVSKIAVISILFTSMYRLAAEPFFLSGLDSKDFIRQSAAAMKYFIIISIMIFLMINFYVEIFALFIGPAFRQGLYILPVILLSNLLSGIVFNLSFWYKKSGRTQFAIVVTGTGLIFTVIFNIMLVPKLGIMGAALARLVCESVMVLLSYILNRKYYRTPYDMKRIGFYFLLGAVMFSCSLLTDKLPLVWKYAANSVILGLFVITVIKREAINITSFLKRK